MKKFLTAILSFGCLAITSQAQYEFLYSNPTAPTHIGSIDGPLAGPDIWAQMFAGLEPDGLSPFGIDRRAGRF